MSGHRCVHCQRTFPDREALFQHSAAKHGRRQAENINPKPSSKPQRSATRPIDKLSLGVRP